MSNALQTLDRSTGEVVTTPTFDMSQYLNDVTSARAFQVQQSLAAAYDKAVAALIGPNDVQVEKGRTFKKKSAWRKLARHFQISSAVTAIDKQWEGEDFIATVTVRASAPWGQYAEAVGACSTSEAVGRRVITIADAIATAETRATNRATSNLIAMGEVSAEEMGDRSPRASRTAPSHPRESLPATPGDTLMPGAASKWGGNGGKPMKEIEEKVLQGFADWVGKQAEPSDTLTTARDAALTVLAERTAGSDGFEAFADFGEEEPRD